MSTPAIRPADRLSLTLFVAVVVHALIILGIGFTPLPERKHERPPLIEITLAERPSAQAPEDYDYLAQADQDGGGFADDAQRPQRQSAPQTPGLPEGSSPVPAVAAASPPPRPEQRPDVISREQAPLRLTTPELALPDTPAADAPQFSEAQAQPARASEFLRERDSGLPRYPSKLRLDARTRAHDAAAYMHAWVGQVERVGNLNYPDEARRRGLSGRVVLEVTLRPDGSLHEMQILRSSSHAVLDQAALRVVQLAAPFAPVPPAVLQDNDLLVIVRTWEFLQGSTIQTH